MATYHNRQIVKYSTVFGKKPGDAMELLRRMNKSTAVKIIARMNHLARTKVVSTVDEVLNMWFGNSNVRFRTIVRRHIFAGYSSLGVPGSQLTIISMWSNLKILDLLLSEPENDYPETSGDETERDFFMVYLAINEIFGDGSNAIVETVGPDKENLGYWYAKCMMVTLIRYQDFANVSPREVLAAQIIRAYYCLKFLEQNGHQQLVELFLQQYGVSNWQEYFRLILPICSGPLTKGDGSGLYYFLLQDNPDYERRSQFIRRLALSGTEGYPVIPDFLHVRSRPLYETEPNRFLVCDTILTINRVHSSMFFELKDIAASNQHLHSRYDNFFSFYTSEFIEKYLSYTLLSEIFADSGYYQLSGEEIKNRFKINQEPDYYIRNNNKVFLFEIKGSILPGEIKQSFDYQVIEDELKKKFYQKPGNKKNIGILQLVDRIEILLNESKKIPFDDLADQRKLEIYPILLTTERALNTPGMNHIFNEWFQEALNERSGLSGRLYQIKPLSILDMDTLINFSDMFKGKKVFLEESLRAYHQFIKVKMPVKGVAQSLDKAKENMNQAMISYADFLISNYKPDLPELFTHIGKQVSEDKNPRQADPLA
ncbi:hypothetical protein [Pedobacter ginsengisoli]|nr:hypothetical protein [Pedobacter ginsengisoli]